MENFDIQGTDLLSHKTHVSIRKILERDQVLNACIDMSFTYLGAAETPTKFWINRKAISCLEYLHYCV